MQSIYLAGQWYWLVGADTTHVWSGAAAAYVPTTDPGYAAWLAAGNTPSSASTEADLFDVLTRGGASTGSLGTAAQRAALLLAGCAVTLTSAGTPALSGSYSVTPASIANLTAVQAAISAGVGLPGGGATLPWTDATGADHAFTAAQFTAFAAAVMNYVFALTRCAFGKSTALPSAALTIP